MGDAWHLRRKEFESWGVQVRSSNYTLYGDLSARVMRVLSELTLDLKVYRINKAFSVLSGFADPEGHARTLRESIGRETGVSVCDGISTTKTVAKVAKRTAKKDPASGGVCCLPDEAGQTVAWLSWTLGTCEVSATAYSTT